MPIYDYFCKSCDHSFDALQKISEPKLIDCPKCGKSTLKKMLSAPKFRLKGKGWYETDFKTGNKRNLAGGPDKKSVNNSTNSEKSAKKDKKKNDTNKKVKSV
tara:strand:- start:196 stop:501 length:306 start_codon:yes stop_codon:yes gene_type:complete